MFYMCYIHLYTLLLLYIYYYYITYIYYYYMHVIYIVCVIYIFPNGYIIFQAIILMSTVLC